MRNFFHDPKVLCKVYYDNGDKLSTRLNMWHNYGISKISFIDYLKSILKDQYDVYIDLGCGNAFNSSALLNRVVKRAYMCDISSSILEEAKKNVYKVESEAEVVFLNENIKQTSVETQSCNLITLMHVLHHVDNIERVFEEVKRIASHGATLIITTYNHTLKDFLNVNHYENLSKLNFPQYMKDKKSYLMFNGDNAFDITKKYFGKKNVVCYNYENHAIVNDAQVIMDYYTSAMMYRMSKGVFSKDITKEMWSQLETLMREKVEKELEKKGNILISGLVTVLEVNL